MTSGAVLGLPIEIPADLAQPLEAAMVVKGLDAEGKICYWTAMTGGLQTVEVVGMMTWGACVALGPHAGDSEWE